MGTIENGALVLRCDSILKLINGRYGLLGIR